MAGSKNRSDGVKYFQGSEGRYWSSSPRSDIADSLVFDSTSINSARGAERGY